MTVSELGDRMSSLELSEWMAYYDIEPWGEERADLRQAMTTSAVHNSIQAQAKHPRWTKPGDFMPFSKQAQPNTVDVAEGAESLRAKFLALAGNGKAVS